MRKFLIGFLVVLGVGLFVMTSGGVMTSSTPSQIVADGNNGRPGGG
jgi:hypothetical protein